jgi:hypothetical protein
MSNKYKFRDQDKPYFVSFSVVYWPGVFIRDVYRDILLASLRYGRQNKGLEVYARVVVTNRAHPATGRKGGDEMPGTLSLRQPTGLCRAAGLVARPGVFIWLIHPRKPEDLPHDRYKSRFAKTCASGVKSQKRMLMLSLLS